MAGPWIARLLEEVVARTECQLCVAAPYRTAGIKSFSENGVEYVFLKRRRAFHYWNYSWDGLQDASRLINDFQPSLIHVHGSEHCLGLAHQAAAADVPAVLSLQGVLAAYAPKALGDLDFLDVLRQERLLDLCRMSGVLGIRRAWRQGAVVERQILNAHRHFLGRTEWDRQQLASISPNASYHHVGEMLRTEFYARRWQPNRHENNVVFFGNLAGAHKGGHTILRALALLKKEFPHTRFHAAGRIGTDRGYGRLFLQEARRLGVSDRVSFLGYLDADAMAKELENAAVFVSASYIDNSPNSVGEAQIVGTPVVGSYVGGVPEMLDYGKAGLLFPAGDSEMLASRIGEVFRDQHLAERLSHAGRQKAGARHDADRVMSDLLAAYAAAGCAVSLRGRSA